MKELLKAVILDQQAIKWNDGCIKREIDPGLISCAEIIVISGIRRCGKSTLLQQIRAGSEERSYSLNFDDERLVTFSLEDFQLLFETFIELYGLQKTWYFDEIQNVAGWERFVRRLHDLGHKIFITGSNATMLSREMGTHLTGRYIRVELFPFSFREFLLFRGYSPGPDDVLVTEGRSSLMRYFNEYFTMGGFPLYLKNKNDQYLKSLYESILYRDVLVRNHLTNEKELLELVYYLSSNVSKTFTYNSLKRVVHVKNATTIKNYMEFLQNTYLLFQVNKFDYALSKQLQNAKKLYFIDNALVSRLGFQFSDEKGRMLENLVFIELLRRGKEVFYHHSRHECDFVIRTGTRISEAIQVCYTFETAETRERELKGINEAMRSYQLDYGLIITRDHEEKVETEAGVVRMVAAWRWMLALSASR